ncbi:unnamed protein product [Blepharisma stoltei]|uniref:Uncharacterized protein n=1 Tax=Blepharisma stoltei TaxID=1481888 RepID=A0AAU9KBJ0_9CILI|nr:unnamed protein product [Blepharisma stoltei]
MSNLNDLISQHSTPRDLEISFNRQADIDKIDPETNTYLLYKWSARNILNHLELSSILEIENQFEKQKTLQIEEFVWLILQVIQHEIKEKVYVTAGAITLYIEVLKQKHKKSISEGILWNELSEYILELALNSKNNLDLPATKLIENAPSISEAPLVFGAKEHHFSRIHLSTRLLDKYHHQRSIRQGIYAPSAKCLFTLDQVSSHIRMYGNNSQLKGKIEPVKSNHLFEGVILDFAWSEQYQRIGAAMQDFSLTFWDYRDDFSYEKILKTNPPVEELQNRIWFVDRGIWFTTDKTNALYEWDIETENPTLWPNRHAGKITGLIEFNGVLATSALDRNVVLWEMKNKASLCVITLPDVSAHTLAYSFDFQYLVTAAYETTPLVWNLETMQDISIFGKLEGHVHTVSAMAVINGTPLAVTADDTGFIKVWDLRNLKCLQTLNQERMEISKIIPAAGEQFFCAVGCRVYWFEYESFIQTNANGINNKEIEPTALIYSRQDKELLLSTKSDLRVFDIYTGKQSRIIADVTDAASEVCQMTLTHLGMRVIISNQKGETREIQHANGVTMNAVTMHKEEIICLNYSLRYDMLFTAGWDNLVKIWADGSYYEPLKVLSDVHEDSLARAACSWEQGIFATCSESGVIAIWDIFNLCSRGSTKIEEEVDSIYLSEHLPLLTVAEISGRISVYNLSTVESIHQALFWIRGECIVELPIKIAFDVTEEEFFEDNKIFATGVEESGKELKYGMYIGSDHGFVSIWNVGRFIKGVKSIQREPDSVFNKKMNIDASTFAAIINLGIGRTKALASSPEAHTSNNRVQRWKAHKDNLNDMIVCQISEKLIITVGNDAVIKIWNTKAELKGHINLTRLQPDLWNLKINTFAYRERLYSQAEILLAELANNYDLNYSLPVKQHLHQSSTVRTFDLVDAQNRVTAHSLPKIHSEKHKSSSTLRQIDIKKKSADKYKKIFNPITYGLKEYDDVTPPKKFEQLEPIEDKPPPKKRNWESVADLAKKLDSIDKSFDKTSYRQTESQMFADSYHDEAKKKREREFVQKAIKKKKIQIKNSSRSSSVPLLPRRPYHPPKAHSRVYKLVQDLNNQVIKSMNKNSLPVHIRNATPNKLSKISKDYMLSKAEMMSSPHFGLPMTPAESAANIMKGYLENQEMFDSAAKSVVKLYQEMSVLNKLSKNL